MRLTSLTRRLWDSHSLTSLTIGIKPDPTPKLDNAQKNLERHDRVTGSEKNRIRPFFHPPLTNFYPYSYSY